MSTEPAPTAAARAFTPAEASMITGVTTGLQLQWRYREILPGGDGRSWTAWDQEGLCRLALLRELSACLPLKFARTLTEDFLASMQSALSGALTEELALAAAPGELAGERPLYAEQLAVVSWTEDSAFWRGTFGLEELRDELQRETPEGQPTFGFRAALIINLTHVARAAAKRIVLIERADAFRERQRRRHQTDRRDGRPGPQTETDL